MFKASSMGVGLELVEERGSPGFVLGCFHIQFLKGLKNLIRAAQPFALRAKEHLHPDMGRNSRTGFSDEGVRLPTGKAIKHCFLFRKFKLFL